MRISDWSSDVCSSDLLTVQAEGLNRKRFDPRREDLFRFREAFAEALRSRGVEAEATPSYSRGQGRAGTSMALTQLRSSIRSGASRQPTDRKRTRMNSSN